MTAFYTPRGPSTRPNGATVAITPPQPTTTTWKEGAGRVASDASASSAAGRPVLEVEVVAKLLMGMSRWASRESPSSCSSSPSRIASAMSSGEVPDLEDEDRTSTNNYINHINYNNCTTIGTAMNPPWWRILQSRHQAREAEDEEANPWDGYRETNDIRFRSSENEKRARPCSSDSSTATDGHSHIPQPMEASTRKRAVVTPTLQLSIGPLVAAAGTSLPCAAGEGTNKRCKTRHRSPDGNNDAAEVGVLLPKLTSSDDVSPTPMAAYHPPPDHPEHQDMIRPPPRPIVTSSDDSEAPTSTASSSLLTCRRALPKSSHAAAGPKLPLKKRARQATTIMTASQSFGLVAVASAWADRSPALMQQQLAALGKMSSTSNHGAIINSNDSNITDGTAKDGERAGYFGIRREEEAGHPGGATASNVNIRTRNGGSRPTPSIVMTSPQEPSRQGGEEGAPPLCHPTRAPAAVPATTTSTPATGTGTSKKFSWKAFPGT
jgi:hypothetical protein